MEQELILEQEQEQIQSPKIMLSIQEAADELGIGYAKVLQMVHIEKFPAIRIGNRWRISRSGLQAWVDETVRSGRKQIL